jgi:hypothetical protein
MAPGIACPISVAAVLGMVASSSPWMMVTGRGEFPEPVHAL